MTNNTIPNVPRQLLERASNLAFQTQHYPLHEELRTLLSAPSSANHVEDVRAMVADPSPAGVDGLEVVGHIESDDDVSGSYAVFKNDCDLRDGTELVRMSDAVRAIARIQDECELLRNFKIAYNEWQDKTEWVQQTATVKELGKHRADVLKDRLSGWIARMNQPYDDADIGN